MVAWTFVILEQKKFRNAGIYQTNLWSPKGEKQWLLFDRSVEREQRESTADLVLSGCVF